MLTIRAPVQGPELRLNDAGLTEGYASVRGGTRTCPDKDETWRVIAVSILFTYHVMLMPAAVAGLIQS